MMELTISELDKGFSYRCAKCQYDHLIKPEDTCRNGRGMYDDGCNSKLFSQGVYWFREGVSDRAWDRGCWHWVEVPKGNDADKTLKEYISTFRG